MKQITFLLLLCVFTSISSEDKTCKSHSDCKSDKQESVEPCSVCADSSNGKSTCVFPFPYQFPTGDFRCPVLSPCPMQCNRGAPSCTARYAPSCRCSGRDYGSECQYEAKAYQKPVYILAWQFKGFFPVYDTTELTLILESVYTNRDYRHTRLTLNTSDGFYISKTGWKEQPGKCLFKHKLCTALHLPIKFPYKMFSTKYINDFITLNNKILGYYANFTLEVIDLGQRIYQKQYQIIVSYENKLLKCIALIQLRNCGKSTETPTIFTRRTSIDFANKVIYVTDGGYVSTSVADETCSDGNIYTWKMWSFKDGDETSPPMFENYTIQTWHFNPYSLDIGMYKVLFEVQHVKKSNAKNLAYCYFKVVTLPLILRVEGGSDRMINKNYGLILSAARSSDPNMPPSDQQHLLVEWSCTTENPPKHIEPVCRRTTTYAKTPYIIPPHMLSYSVVYNFTVKLWSRRHRKKPYCHNCYAEPQYDYIRIQVGNETSNTSISILCVENCFDKVNPNEPLLLKVTSENINISDTKFMWTYSNDTGQENVLDPYRVENMPEFMLLLGNGFLIGGVEYTITVRGSEAYAKYDFLTDILEYTEDCKVEPNTGQKGLTPFEIICPLKKDYPLIYEFYDKSHDDTMAALSFNGRMLGTSSTGQLHGVKLTRGYVTVFIINSKGVSIKKEVIVELSEWNVTTEIINDLKKNMTDSLMYFTNDHGVMRLSSLITDILPIKGEDDFNYLLRSLSKITIDTFPRIKLLSSSLYIVLTGFNTPIQLQLHTSLLVDVVDFIGEISNQFRHFVFNRDSSQYTPSTIIKEIAEVMLHCLSLIVKCNGNKTVDLYEDELFSTAEKNALRYGSYNIEHMVDNLKDVLNLIQRSGKPPLQISTNNGDFKMWAITNDMHYPISRYLDINDKIPISISDGLIYSLSRNAHANEYLSLQSAYIGDSNFNWFKSDIKSNYVSVSLTTREGKKDLKYIHSLNYPLTIRMTMEDNLQNMKVEGSTKQADPNLNLDYLDSMVNIHRIDIRPRSYMSIVFLYPPTNGSLRVAITEEYRPDFSYMIKHSIAISKESAKYPHRYHEYDDPKFLYMGVIPGKEELVNQIVEYAFEVNTTLCQYRSRGLWKSHGCLIHHHTQGNDVSCQCRHLSTFGTAFLVPPQQVDPFGDAKLFLTVLDNPLVVSLVVTLLIVYFILFLFLSYKDKKDEVRKRVVYLEDNFSFDTHPYLIAVFTSLRLHSGTTANVGVQLVGSEETSRAHILKSNQRKVLKKGSDDWFLIKCPKYLGDIICLHLWHDNGGRSPDWYCDKIFVYDLINKTETRFVVGQWLSLYSMVDTKQLCYPEAMILPSGVEDISSVKRKFLDNVVLGLREGHSLTRVFYRHPRSQVTRVQRFSIIVLYIMVAMLCSIMFYIPEDDTDIGMDDYMYSVGTKELVISIECLIISAVLTWMVLFAFKRSYHLTHHRDSKTKSLHRRGHKRPTLYSKFVEFVTLALKNPPLDPVQLPKTPKITKLRRFWYITAWTICVTIILLCAYFIMLYGLKLGPVKSKKWLSSVLLAVGEDSFVTAPAKILLFSLGLAITLQLIVDVNTYSIGTDVLYKMTPRIENSDVFKVLSMRRNKIYAPLCRKTRLKIIEDKKITDDWCSILRFVLAMIFVLVMYKVIFILWSSHYYTNHHVRDMIAETKYPVEDSIRFSSVSNITELEYYLENSLINAIYRSRWYDKEFFKTTHDAHITLMSDITNKLVGRPKIRQLRTEPVFCSNFAMKNRFCIPEWKKSIEDTNIYSKGWKPASYIDVKNKDSYWVYREESTLFKHTLFKYYGRSGRLFHDGGYSVTLGPTRYIAEQTLHELIDEEWMDIKTRVVFVELTAFNVNQGLFTRVTLIVEYMITGKVFLKAQVNSVSSILQVNVWIFLFVVFTIFQTVKTIHFISYYGLVHYFTYKFYNIVRIVDIILGYTSIVLFCIHFYTASKLNVELQHSEYGEYVAFDSYFQYFVLLQISLSVLLGISMLRVIGFIRGDKSIMFHFRTFTVLIKYMYFMTVLILFLFFVLMLWAFILDITSFSLKEIFVNTRSLMYVTNQQLRNTEMKIFILFKLFSIYVISIMFLVVLVYKTKLSKSSVFTIEQRFDFITFIVSRIINNWNKIKARKIYKQETF